MTSGNPSRALLRLAAVWLTCAIAAPLSAQSQAAQSQSPAAKNTVPATPPAATTDAAPDTAPEPAASMPPTVPLAQPSRHDRSQASKHFKRGRKAFKKDDLETAEQEYAEAARLDPVNAKYVAERELTRTKLVAQLLEDASHARATGDHATAADALSRAHQLDPANSLVDEQVRAEAAAVEPVVLPSGDLSRIDSGVIQLAPTPGKQPVHFSGSGKELIRQVFQRFGITATLDDSVSSQQVKAFTEDMDFNESVRLAMLLTNSFYVPLDPHRVLVAKDNKEDRTKFERQFVETIYLPGLTDTEMQDATNVVKQILNVTQATTNKGQGTMTIRAPENTLKTVNSVLTDLYEGHSQVLMTLTMYQITRTRMHTVGVDLPSQFTLFNVPAEYASLYSQYATIIEQLIAQGLVNANNPLEILAALIASGELTNSIFTQGFFLFGGGLSAMGVGFGGGTANMQLNSSDVRQLDKVQLRVGNLETATFRNGTRYPIVTASYTAVGTANNAATAGTNILQLLQQNGISTTASAATPNIQYEDLGLTLKATPTVQKSGDISLKLEMTMSALAGSSLNNVPVLANRELKTTIGVREGEASIIASNMSRQETRAILGIPGLNDIPGFPATNVENDLDVSELVMVLTPHVVRLEHPLGLGRMVILPLH